MIGAALHLRDEVTQPDACPWWGEADTLPVSSAARVLSEPCTRHDNTHRRRAQLSCNTPRLTRAQAMYAVLWLGVDAQELRGWL